MAAGSIALVIAAEKQRARRNLLIRLGSVGLILAIWEIVGLLVPPIFLAPFHRSVIAAYSMAADGSLLRADRRVPAHDHPVARALSVVEGCDRGADRGLPAAEERLGGRRHGQPGVS